MGKLHIPGPSKVFYPSGGVGNVKVFWTDIEVECDGDNISDGHHTFKELYEHRCTLFAALMRSHPQISWRSLKNSEGEADSDWFLTGMHLPTGDVSYHLPIGLWGHLDGVGITTLELAPHWDGHTSKDVLVRLRAWLSTLNNP